MLIKLSAETNHDLTENFEKLLNISSYIATYGSKEFFDIISLVGGFKYDPVMEDDKETYNLNPLFNDFKLIVNSRDDLSIIFEYKFINDTSEHQYKDKFAEYICTCTDIINGIELIK